MKYLGKINLVDRFECTSEEVDNLPVSQFIANGMVYAKPVISSIAVTDTNDKYVFNGTAWGVSATVESVTAESVDTDSLNADSATISNLELPKEGLVIASSTASSTKKFVITVTDDGEITATELE